MPGSEGFYVPSWSPDGKHLVAIAQNPSRMVLYSAGSGTWRDLRKFEVVWGYWVWSNDSKSVYIAMTAAELGFEPGIHRLTIADEAWNQIAKFDGLTLSRSGAENFPSLTTDGRLAIMNDTSAVQSIRQSGPRRLTCIEAPTRRAHGAGYPPHGRLRFGLLRKC